MIIVGGLFLTLGCIGIAVPILPTTPFVILAAACFSASSEKVYNMLVNNRFFGQYIRHYREKTGISIGVKIFTLSFLYIALLVSGLLIRHLAATITLSIVGTLVTVHILMIKTRRADK